MSQAKLARARKAIQNGEAYAESDDEDEDGCVFGGFDDLGGFDGWEPKSAEPLPSDSDDDDDSVEGDADDLPLSSLLEDVKVKAEKKESKKRAKTVIARLERENSSALVLVSHNKKIAESVLKDRNITVKKGNIRPKIKFNRHSHQQGKEDSREIDLDQKALKQGAPSVKVDKKKARVSYP